jgi:hypothetical protein
MGLNHAGLVVQFGDGSIETFCIPFGEESISGHTLLTESGLPLEQTYNPQGVAMCKIGNYGCPPDNCFCDSPPNYWSYWHLEQNEWIYSPFGSSTHDLRDGDVDGWSWGIGDPPGITRFDQVCPME